MDGRGRPLAVVVTPGQAHDGQSLPSLLGDLRVPKLAIVYRSAAVLAAVLVWMRI
ncbi:MULTISPECIES: hypothetical protein [Streptomyces]|uniref:hypothetical protein n=1 Tax=Streptomyces lycopersici TaxID=2974589 RepID=UPI0021D13081|nr:hypothetical protein [Streptomyces sp. NEAU-383]